MSNSSVHAKHQSWRADGEEKLPPFNHDGAFRKTEPPHPNFQPSTGGAGSKYLDEWRKTGEEVGHSQVDPTKVEPGAMYRLLIGGITPRPVALVSSVAEDGTRNLAPFSWFNMVCNNPPLLMVSCRSPGKGLEKDTAANIKCNRTFTVNIISEPFVECANWTSVDAPRHADEWRGSGLTMAESTLVEPPRVKESAFSMECELWKDIDLTTSGPDPFISGVLLIGLIKLVHVRNDVWVSPDDTAAISAGKRAYAIDHAKLKPISRLGGLTFSRLGEAFDLPRPQWDEVKHLYGDQEKDDCT